MPTLRCTGPLPQRPRRILSEGSPGGSKSTLAQAIASALQIRYVEMDALAHGHNWTMRPSFHADVGELASQPSWVTEWQFDQVRDILTARDDLMVWLDLPRSTVLRQLDARTLSLQTHHT